MFGGVVMFILLHKYGMSTSLDNNWSFSPLLAVGISTVVPQGGRLLLFSFAEYSTLLQFGLCVRDIHSLFQRGTTDLVNSEDISAVK